MERQRKKYKENNSKIIDKVRRMRKQAKKRKKIKSKNTRQQTSLCAAGYNKSCDKQEG